MIKPVGVCGLVLATLAGISSAEEGVHHQLSVRLDLAGHGLAVRDVIDIQGSKDPERRVESRGDGSYLFVLHADLEPRVVTRGWRLTRTQLAGESVLAPLGIAAAGESERTVPHETWRLVPGRRARFPVELRYSGQIHHPLATAGEEYQRSFSETPGTIGEEGVYLAGGSFWVPAFGPQLVTFELNVSGLPSGWGVVSQGRRTRSEVSEEGVGTVVWSCSLPMEEVYLVAGPWAEYRAEAGDVDVLVLLRETDDALAERYMSATSRYLALYEGMLPSYPYRSFSVVENFWETGYGMPGFTLLGSRVLRFPWILTSSFPHELLHNWWGNSVYLPSVGGNWCEGLTAYMADHLLAEARGEGERYRRDTLKKYSDFVDESRDFPLARFSSRSSAASEAVGYGKSLMIFHMLRRELNDEGFLEATSSFYGRHRFSRASFDDLAASFSETAERDMLPFLNAWVERTGAPALAITQVAATAETGGEGWTVDLALGQVQEEEPFPLTVPVAVTVEGEEEALQFGVKLEGRAVRERLAVPGRPLRVDVDPAFDCMRRLDALEVPPAISSGLGDEAPLYVLPSAASEEERGAWEALARGWQRGKGEPRVVLDGDLATLPAGNVWVLGWANRYREAVLRGLAADGVSVMHGGVRVGGTEVSRDTGSLVLVARRAGEPAAAVAWVAAAPTAAIPGLARKLPHYGRYSYLAFTGEEPTNTAKGQWQASGSPLTRFLGEERPPLRLPRRVPLAELPAAPEGGGPPRGHGRAP